MLCFLFRRVGAGRASSPPPSYFNKSTEENYNEKND